jgi:hypothetical protein
VLADAYVHELGENESAGRSPEYDRRTPLGTALKISQARAIAAVD